MNRDCQIAWAAGLFEGEGTFGFRKVRSGRAPADMRLGMTDQDTVEAFAEIVSVGTIRVDKRSDRGVGQDLYVWIVSGMDSIKQVIELFLPYFKSRRAATANEALEYINSDRARRELQLGMTCVNGHIMTEATFGFRSSGYNVCRICRRESSRRWESKQPQSSR